MSRQKRRMQRRTVLGLGGEETRQPTYFSSAEKLANADVASQDTASTARGDHDVVGCPKAEVLPEFIGERLRSLEEEWVPGVTGVEDIVRLSLGRI